VDALVEALLLLLLRDLEKALDDGRPLVGEQPLELADRSGRARQTASGASSRTRTVTTSS